METELIQEVPSVAEPEAMVVEVPEVRTALDDAEMAGTYTWEVDWPKPLKTKSYSDKFEIGTYIWRLLVIPGNDNPAAEYLSVFLDSPEASLIPTHLSPRAKFALTLESSLGPEAAHVKDAEHLFTSTQQDWGFNQFLTMADINDPGRGFVQGGKLRLTVQVAVRKDERLSWDSRKETGYVGLKNQGATCYMNSLLQCLFHLPYFRKAVYHMPTNESDDPSKSMPLALQSVFYKLQYGRTPASTKDLTKSFGWNTYDAFFQHDVQELNRVLCEKLDDRMKGTVVEKSINYLFEGHTESYVRCKDVDVRSTKRESFMDIQLVVKGCVDVYASFDKYCEVEELVGDNKYRTDSHGLQDAVKGLKFQALPPVLQLHLRRFDYDYQRDTMLKINDRYEFPEELDLDREGGRYLAEGADTSVRNLYRLHSVLVHSGGVHGGHYYAFIRPDGQQWYRFDDERVTREDARAAVEEQYGDDDDGPPGGGGYNAGGGGFKPGKLSNAYMLVYVRVSQWGDVMCRVTKDDIPAYLRDRLEVEQREKEARQRAKAEAHLYCNVRLARDADMAAQVGSAVWFDLVDYERLGDAASLRVRKHTKFGELKRLVAERFGVAPEAQRYWSWTKRQNSTVRLADKVLGPEHDGLSLMDLREHNTEIMTTASKHALIDLRLYLETPWPDASKPLPPLSKNTILVFLKYYDAAAETLAYVGHLFAPKAARMRDLFPGLRKFAGLAPDAPLAAFEEVKWDPAVMVVPIAPDALLHSGAQLETGDIIAFQLAPGAEGVAAAGAKGGAKGGAAAAPPAPRFPTVQEFLTYVHNRLVVKFKPLSSPEEEGFTLELLRTLPYAGVTSALAERLGAPDPECVRLTQQNSFSAAPQRIPVGHKFPGDLQRLLFHGHHTTDTLYYEVLDMPLAQLETLKALKLHFVDERTRPVGEQPLVVRVPKDATVAAALDEARRSLPAEHAAKKLRLMEVYRSRVYKVCHPGDPVDRIDDSYWTLRLEPVQPGEDAAAPAGGLVCSDGGERPGDGDDKGAAAAAGGGGGEGDLLVMCCHVAPDRKEVESQALSNSGSAANIAAAAGGGGKGGGKDAKQQQQQQQPDCGDDGGGGGAPVPVIAFGEPFLLTVGRAEPLSAVKERIRCRLDVPPEAFAKWRFCFVQSGRGSGLPQYLGDGDVPAQHFLLAHTGHNDASFLGCEHEDRGAKRPSGHRAAYSYERAVKINA